MRAPAVSSSHVFIHGATLNGRPHDRAVVSHADVMQGGTLSFEMADTPSTTWAAAEGTWPRTAVTAPLVSPAPFAAQGRADFTGSMALVLGALDPAASIHATLDGAIPTPALPRVTGPLTIDRTTTVTAIAVSPARPPSAPVSFVMHALRPGVRVTTSEPWAPQYSAGGVTALIDGRRGGSDFRLGQWQGYHTAAVTITIDLGASQLASQVSAGFLHEPGAWVVMPRGIDVDVSADGERWSAMPGDKTATDPLGPATAREDATVRFPSPVEIRYVRVHVTGYGILPASHVGAGDMSWIFMDEIEVK